MGKVWFRRLKEWIMDGYDKKYYDEYRNEIEEYNVSLLQFFNRLILVLLILMYILAFFNEYVSSLQWFYLGMTVFSVLEILLDRYIYDHRREWIEGTEFLCIAKMYVFCIISGITFNTDGPVISFYAFLIVMSILFIMRPWKICLFNFGACMVFAIYSYLVKPPEIVTGDWFNCGMFFLIAGAVSFWIVKLRLGFIRNEKLLTLQRDTDILTSLPNRRRFNIYAEEIFQSGEKEKVSFLMMDIDHFKAYNDSKGHIAGDICLESIGKELGKFGEENGIFFARYGGEEFIAIDVRHRPEELPMIAEKIVQRIFGLGLPHESTKFRRITISVGYAVQAQVKAENYQQLLECADQALYRAKQDGRNKAEPYVS